MRATSQVPEMLGRGIYTPGDVARMVGMSSSRVRRWVAGYRFTYETADGARQGASPPVVEAELPVLDSRRAVTFLELIEVLVVRALLQRGVTMRTVRRAYGRTVTKLGTPHPFALEKLRTDGKGVFIELARQSDDYKPLLEMASGQYALPKILIHYLDQIDFDAGTLLAERWWPLGKGVPVVLDPCVAFGAPVIEGTRIPVGTVINAIRAGESRTSVCRWLDLSKRQVAAALKYTKWGRAA